MQFNLRFEKAMGVGMPREAPPAMLLTQRQELLQVGIRQTIAFKRGTDGGIQGHNDAAHSCGTGCAVCAASNAASTSTGVGGVWYIARFSTHARTASVSMTSACQRGGRRSWSA